MIIFTKPIILFVFLAVSIYGTVYSSGVFFFVFRIDNCSNIETKPSVQESLGIFQLIDQIETAVDKLLERQVYFACTVQVGVIKRDVAIQYFSKCLIL
jgi:hypothetical protein